MLMKKSRGRYTRKKGRKPCVITSMMNKITFKNRGQKKRKKAKRDNLNVDEKEQWRKYKEKGKTAMLDNLGSDEKEQVRKEVKKRKMSKRL